MTLGLNMNRDKTNCITLQKDRSNMVVLLLKRSLSAWCSVKNSPDTQIPPLCSRHWCGPVEATACGTLTVNSQVVLNILASSHTSQRSTTLLLSLSFQVDIHLKTQKHHHKQQAFWLQMHVVSCYEEEKLLFSHSF